MEKGKLPGEALFQSRTAAVPRLLAAEAVLFCFNIAILSLPLQVHTGVELFSL